MKLLTTAETADLLGISQKTLRNWRTTGGGPPAIVVGRRSVRYSTADLDAWIAANRQHRTPMPEAS